ncbi:hypothetical protein [Sporosarcina aquimarina]|uniref:Peptide ABC transporter permease n=1 Tax=Sporosarcina aquimarina TaxID=114975 RepID=A0ABU4G1T5_9BACL|nr:hypothetical protein [Sporosarcina aquimarina]MDW0110931.1 hypothetical protein [Sporosarcina aquimarina]
MQIPTTLPSLAAADLSTYWPGFQAVAYAVYDDESVYLFNHPNYPQELYTQLPWSEAFVGNTLIQFHDYPTAIVRRADCADDVELVAVMVHELFHGYQNLQGELRFPDEVQGVLYPLDTENAALRALERYYLYHAVLPTDKMARDRHLRQFIVYRQKRMAALGTSMQYELLTETLEGPAFYVESKVMMEHSDLLDVEIVRNYGEGLLDKEDTVRHIRKSCYSSGVFLCYVLDRIRPNWQEELFASDVTLYSLVQQSVEFREDTVIEPVEPLEVSDELLEILSRVKAERAAAFAEAEQSAAAKLTINGDFKIVGFDPMNIVLGHQRALHNRFIRVEILGSPYLFRRPVIAEYRTDLFRSPQLTLLLDEQPEVREDGVFVPGIGELPGRYEADTFTLTVTDNK